MILRFIRVEGWRRFAGAVSVGPFTEGLNVVHAPNGTGKSTLFEALLRTLMDHHAVGGREVEALRPWGRALAPTATVEFAHAGVEYRLTKRFLDKPSSDLSRKEDGAWVPLAPGDAADDMVRKLLTRNPPGRGLSRPENWGLAQVLWAPQGGLAMGRLSGDVVADIRQSLGAHVLGPGGSALEQRIEKAWQEFFTPLGKLRTGRDAPPVVKTHEALRAAITRVRDAQTQHAAFEHAAQQIDALRSARADALARAGALSEQLASGRERAAAYGALVTERREREARAREAEAHHRALKQQVAAIRAARKELRDVAASAERLRADAPLRAREVEDRGRLAAGSRRTLEDALRDARAAEDAAARAESAARFLDAIDRAASLSRRLAGVESARARVAVLERERRALAAPDAVAMRAIRRAAAERAEARVRLEAAMVTLEFVPERELAVDVIAGETPGRHALAAGLPAVLRGSPDVVVDIPGVGRVRASGPASSVATHRAARDRTEREYDALTAGYGTDDPDALESLAERAAVLDARVRDAESEAQSALEGESDASLARERARALNESEGARASHPEWTEARPPAIGALRADAERARRACGAASQSAEAELETARSAHAAATSQHAALVARLEETDRRHRALEARLAELTSDGRADAERDTDLSRIALAWDAAVARVAEVDEQLRAAGEDPRAAAVRLERELRAADEASTRALEAEKTTEGRLEHLSAQGTYSALASAEEEVARLEAQLVRDRLQADAVRLLRATVAGCRDEAVAAIAEPVSDAATRTLHRIAGDALGRVKLGDSFEPRGVGPAAAGGAPVGLEEVSGGEQEQIHLATRLALAEILAGGERQLVVLDDALTATDAARLSRAMRVLEDSAARLQVLVITCHPERYASLAGAHVIDLAACIAAHSE